MPLEITNGIGKVGVRLVAATPSYDSDAQAFITAAGLTDTTQKNAVNELVLDLKSANVWTKMKALYPMVGGTATTHKFNLKDPRDLNAAFRLQFNGGWTHSSTGALPNGTTAYADTFLNQSTTYSTNLSTHLSIYSRTNNVSNSFDIGVITLAPDNFFTLTAGYGGVSYYGNNHTVFPTGVSTTTIGFFLNSRTSNTLTKLYKNSSVIGTSTANASTLINRNVWIGARNSTATILYGNRELSFTSIGDGLTDLESLLFYQIVEKFQYTLGRNVNANQSFYYDRNYTNETNAFIVNGGITDTTQRTAVNTLVSTLKTAGIWSKMKAVYPMVGGTATSHKFNLVNPVDTDSAFRLVFNGGWTHSSTGALPNGTTGYANTNLIPRGLITFSNAHLSFYSRTSTNSGNTDIGAFSSNAPAATGPAVTTGTFSLTAGRNTDNNAVAYIANDDPYRIIYSQTNASGMFITSRITTNSLKMYQSGVLKQTNTTVNQATFNYLPSNSIFIGALNYIISTGSSILNYGNKQCAFASIGDGLTDAEATTFYNAVQAFQTTLGRQV